MKIAQVLKECPWGELGVELLAQGVGGRETAVIQLATNWAAMGHEVDTFAPVAKSDETKSLRHDGAHGVYRFLPIELMEPLLSSVSYDAVVSWEAPSVFMNHQILERQRNAKRYLAWQVAHVRPEEMKDVQTGAAEHVALSPWAAEFLRMQGVPDPIHVVPNGVDMYKFPEGEAAKGDRGPVFIYSSSPDRGLDHLMNAWPLIRQKLPDARLTVAYGIEAYTGWAAWSHERSAESALSIIEGIEQPGVHYAGRIGQGMLSKMMLNSSMLLYPCDPASPTETGCITVVEALAAGALPMITDADCLPSEFSSVAPVYALPWDAPTWADWVVKSYELGTHENRRAEGRKFAEGRSWTETSKAWAKLLT